MQRIVEPEILDTLPPGNPEAKRSRADLRFINRMMGGGRHGFCESLKNSKELNVWLSWGLEKVF